MNGAGGKSVGTRLSPANPRSIAQVYRDVWISWGDFLGTDTRGAWRKWRPFKEAQTFALDLKLSARDQWEELASKGALPDDIPTHPNRIYTKQRAKKSRSEDDGDHFSSWE